MTLGLKMVVILAQVVQNAVKMFSLFFPTYLAIGKFNFICSQSILITSLPTDQNRLSTHIFPLIIIIYSYIYVYIYINIYIYIYLYINI